MDWLSRSGTEIYMAIVFESSPTSVSRLIFWDLIEIPELVAVLYIANSVLFRFAQAGRSAFWLHLAKPGQAKPQPILAIGSPMDEAWQVLHYVRQCD
ncbi:MAG TPA: hypothetical protein VNR65_13075, partial [Geobacterales bacterium]|nr:hypothetical protein [Geobacterales bacterium]